MNAGFAFDVWPAASRLWQLEQQFGLNLDPKIYNLVNIPVASIIDILSSKSEQSLPLKVVILQRLIHNNYLSPAHTQQVLSFLKVNDLKKYTMGHQTTMEQFLETVHDLTYEDFTNIQEVEYSQQGLNKGYARVPNGTGEFQIQNHIYNSNNETVGLGLDVNELIIVLFLNPVHEKVQITKDCTRKPFGVSLI